VPITSANARSDAALTLWQTRGTSMATSPPKRRFTVDAKAILTLGRNSIKDHTTAAVELIKNAYDADADSVDIQINGKSHAKSSIRLADNGHGMSDSDLQNHWLRIGFSEKVANKTSQVFRRRKTGEKGIGRLSADRLGSILELKTKSKGQRAIGLRVDWERFETVGLDIGDVVLPELSNPKPKVPERRTGGIPGLGTELLIENLRQEWTKEDVEKLHSELALLLPPYPQLSKNFLLNFSSDLAPDLDGPIQYGKNTIGEIEFVGKLTKAGVLNYRLTFRDPSNRTRRKTEADAITWAALAPDQGTEALRKRSLLGPLEIRLSYFVRRVDLLEGTGLGLTQLKDFLNRNAGVKIYRDMVRVKPYGDPEGPEADWLGLSDRKSRDPAAPNRSNFRVAANQLVGAVFVGRDENVSLVDSSSREGLIENDAFRQLKAVLMRCITRIEAKYHQISLASQRTEKSKAGEAKAAVKKLSGELSTLKVDLAELRSRVSDDLSDEADPVLQQIELVLEHVESAAKQIDEIADQNTVYRGLATVGIASAVFGHETALAISQVKAKLAIASKLLSKDPVNIERVTERITEADDYVDRIAGWGKFALSRVNKDKRQRRTVSVTALVTAILDELGPPMQKSGVTLKRVIKDGINAKTFPMDVEAILINFLTNAYHEVKRVNENRVIQVKLASKKIASKEGFELVVADSGLGIKPKDLTEIWIPLFSTKIDERGRLSGTGLGLAIVKSAVEELGGNVSATAKSQLGGAAFTAWFPTGR
jgi:signal transduction histidine kinase